MRAGRFLLAVLMIATGAVVARPDDVMPLASKLAAPFSSAAATQDGAPASAAAAASDNAAPLQSAPPAATPAAQDHVLPNFVTTKHELTFKDTTSEEQPAQQTAPASSDAPAPAFTPTVSADASPSRPVHTRRAIQIMPVAPSEKKEAASEAPSAEVDPIKAALNSRDAGGGPSPAGLKSTASVENFKTVNGTKVVAAKTLFASARGPSPLRARAIGYYSRGCLAGGVALPVDGPAWQAMRLSRNRNWGHPKLIKLIEDLAVSTRKSDGWTGLLVGDISQPRGGPMLTGHSSHQVGLDADLWLTPMPDRTLTRKERENLSATSMLDKTSLAVDPKVFTDKQVRLIKRAASYPQVERVLVHPAIKKALCAAAGSDRGWLGKVRPYYGHHYHMHIRIGCPAGSGNCRAQRPVTGNDGCGKEVDDWLALLARPSKPPVIGAKKRRPKLPIMLSQLPSDCKMVLESGADGANVPPEALIDPSKVKAESNGSDVVLKPVKERRQNQKREAKAH